MPSESNKRIAKNTIMLYTRQILILFVSLYTVRVILNVLGVEDYGVYNAIGGVVALFIFLSGSMASATQRFFSYSLGEEDSEKLKKTFTVNLIIYVSIAVIALLLLETVGLWFVNQQLKVPPERFEAAQLVYHFSVLTFIATIFTTPFMAIIIAHEDMQIYAYVSIVEALLKLGIVFLLMYIPLDKLKIYGALVLIVATINASIYIGICIKKYKECQFKKFYWDKTLFNDIIKFTGWTLFGQVTTVLRDQAVTILLNQYFTPVVVAARAIATNISNRINIFSTNFNVGLYPPIIKSYATNDKDNMFSLVFNGAKITFFLMWVFALPLFIEMDTILQIWLKTPPEGAVLFTRLALIEVLINSISLPLTTAARAPGKMRTYELILGSFQISIFFIDWILLKLGNPAYTVFIVSAVVIFIMFFVRLIIVNKLIQLPLISFFKQVMLPIASIIALSTIVSLAIKAFLPQSIIFSAISIVTSALISTICMYYIGLNRDWRNKIKGFILNKIQNTLGKQ